MKLGKILIFVVALACNGGVFAQKAPTSKPIGTVIEPRELKQGAGIPWEHEIRVALPPSYTKSNKSYPVLWMMDGALDAALSVMEKAGKSLPEMIVVSIGPPQEALSEFQARRDWDFSSLPGEGVVGYAFEGPGAKLFKDAMIEFDAKKARKGDKIQQLGGAPKFLDFLVDSVRPALARKYRMSDETILWGHSGGGAFCVFALLARPGTFKHYICGSPSLNASDYELFKMEERYAEKHADLPVSLFLGAGDLEITQDYMSAWGITSSAVRMTEILSQRHYPSLKLTFQMFPGKDHGTAMPPILDSGLHAIFINAVQAKNTR